MAREEHDREDLMREATALVRRVELRIPAEPETIIVGFRRDGAASFFFGADPVYQFNTHGELRRAYIDGKLLKAERGRLVELSRVRTARETNLVRLDLDAQATASLLTSLQTRLAELRRALDGGTATVIQSVPVDADVAADVCRELQRLAHSGKIAAAPNAR
jgi:hypothetical protein